MMLLFTAAAASARCAPDHAAASVAAAPSASLEQG
jgi:hypothetical protein